jgi:predicted MFS family arabinose efflux permease
MKDKKLPFSLILLLGLTIGFVFLDRQAISFLFPALVKEFSLTNAQVGQIGMFQTLGFGLFALVFSVLADKSGSSSRKRWFILFLLVTAIFSGASALVSTVGLLMVIRFLTGATEGPVYPLMYAMVNTRSPREKYAVNIGIVMMVHTLVAGMLGPILVTQLLVRFNWHLAFVIVSVPALVLAILMGIFLKEDGPGEGLEAKDQEKAKWADFLKLLRYRNVVLCVFLNILAMAALWMFFTFGPLYFVKVGGMPEQSMGLLMAGVGVSCLAWSFLVPFVSNQIGRRPATILFAVLAATPFVALYLSPGPVAQILVMVLGGTIVAFGQLFMAIISVESVPVHLRATSSAFVMCMGELVGGALAPRIVGGLADSQGLPVVMLAGASCLAAALILGFFLVETNPRASRDASPILQPSWIGK